MNELTRKSLDFIKFMNEANNKQLTDEEKKEKEIRTKEFISGAKGLTNDEKKDADKLFVKDTIGDVSHLSQAKSILRNNKKSEGVINPDNSIMANKKKVNLENVEAVVKATGQGGFESTDTYVGEDKDDIESQVIDGKDIDKSDIHSIEIQGETDEARGYKSDGDEPEAEQGTPPVDTIEGGKADKLSIEDIAKKHDVSVESIQEQLNKGVKIEAEHVGDDRAKAAEISMDHLAEFPDYYSRLDVMETKAEESLIEGIGLNSGLISWLLGPIFGGIYTSMAVKKLIKNTLMQQTSFAKKVKELKRLSISKGNKDAMRELKRSIKADINEAASNRSIVLEGIELQRQTLTSGMDNIRVDYAKSMIDSIKRYDDLAVKAEGQYGIEEMVDDLKQRSEEDGLELEQALEGLNKNDQDTVTDYKKEVNKKVDDKYEIDLSDEMTKKEEKQLGKEPTINQKNEVDRDKDNTFGTIDKTSKYVNDEVTNLDR